MTKNIEALSRLKREFSELGEWLKPLCRYDKIEDFVIADYKENRLYLKIYTKDHAYSISTRLPEAKKIGEGKLKRGDEAELVNRGYLGCIAQTRKPRAGEDWNRGNDLADGSYSKETLEEIVHDILAYELVKVINPANKRIADRVVNKLPVVVGGRKIKL